MQTDIGKYAGEESKQTRSNRIMTVIRMTLRKNLKGLGFDV
jgi:DNA-binding protein Fis